MKSFSFEDRRSKLEDRCDPRSLILNFLNPYAPLKQISIGVLVLALTTLTGCAYYSFTGATIPSHVNTIAIPLAEDNSINPLTSLNASLTDLLINRFVRQTRLQLETSEDDADALLTLTIDRYVNQPTAVSAQEQATLNRVTISVTARYFDQVEEQEVVERSFSSFEEYDPTVGGLEAEEQAAMAALINISEDIFIAATSDW